ncbi:hypothetical protein J2853_000129 [Streptosporangium lutulentum]|uniref:Uncharacterized protein n=1 Tax=Streptosporangium lutulentum TaxID=1461250 RepID=A0ABT9Q3K5_9ACTN|nr:hypothetical protein [Streptosporangium lutulentum]
MRIHFLAPPDDLTEAAGRLAHAWNGYDPLRRVTAPAAMAVQGQRARRSVMAGSPVRDRGP